MVRLIIFIIFVLALDFYALQSFRSVVRNPWVTYGYIAISIVVFGNLIYQGYTLDRSSGINSGFYLAFAVFVLVYVPKLVLLVFMFGEDIFRLFEAAVNYFVSKSDESSALFSSRRKFIGQLALGIAAIPFISILYGITKGKYNFKVLKYTLEFDDLPAAFDGYQVTQISDIHSGSFDNKEKINYAVNLVNEQASDVIMFTGDMVNSKSKEMRPWKSTFSKLKAKDGIFSILGNHDYGDYTRWPSDEAKAENFQELLDIQQEMGFDLLRNESRFIEKDGARLAIIGVENWGKGFKQKGDLTLASSKVDANDFKILLSHDPSHWQYEVVKDPNHYHLTLSGHTHGMQFGIEIPGLIKWSPIKWRYKYWAGIYEKAGQYINVNRGFGFLAFPGRVGIWPEISVITLKKRINNT
ncbi:MAG: metallophosphoesterase [Flavobacteriaceae bacterium]|nr:metallophosphoesterase [Flavobacteriaceae bacterium]